MSASPTPIRSDLPKEDAKKTAEADTQAPGTQTPEIQAPADQTSAAPTSEAQTSETQTKADRQAAAEAERERRRAQKRRDKLIEMAQLDEEDPLSRGKAGGQGQGQGRGGRNKDPDGPAAPVAQPVGPRKLRRRHIGAILSFFVLVAAPTVAAGWYLWERAADRYVSVAGFSVRKEDVGSPMELLGGLASMAGSSSSSDTDILYRFIQSQEMAATIDRQLDLRSLWSKGDPEVDPYFVYHAPGTIEDLTDYWNRMVGVYNDSGPGLIDIKVQAFTPEDAHAIAQAIYDESSRMINELSAVAQSDSTQFSREELDIAVERLKQAREAMTRFRNRTQILDPTASLQSQMGLLSSLESQLAETLIDLDILRQTTAASDPRIVAAERRVEVIEARMQDERDKLGIGTGPGAGDAAGDSAGDGQGEDAFADLLGEYERLSVDQEFAEQAYVAALASFDAAVAQTRKQSRYLAAHVRPTLAERSDEPNRMTLLSLVALFSFLIWAILVLSAYALKDRR